MSNRLDQEREARLQPQRLKSCKEKLESLGFNVIQIDHTQLQFKLRSNTINFWPYSGWYAGRGIGSGRGFKNLLNRLERYQ